MLNNKYFDWSINKTLDIRDGCSFSEWQFNSLNKSFAVHPQGFLIFIPYKLLKLSDEYKYEDPYYLDQNNPFHQRRIKITIELIRESIGGGINKNLGYRMRKRLYNFEN